MNYNEWCIVGFIVTVVMMTIAYVVGLSSGALSPL
jgi:hypothetical protein